MRNRHVVPVLLLLNLVLSAAASAQQDPGPIPNTIVIKAEGLSDAEQALVIKIVEYQISQMLSGNPEAVSAARERLIEPYSKAPKQFFLDFYNQTIASRLGPVADPKQPLICRMNAQLVAKQVKHVKIIDVIKLGLKDVSSAVVYPAAQAAAAITAAPIPADDKTMLELKLGLRAPLTDALKKETSGWVLEYLYQALVDIPRPEAAEAVLTKLNERLAEIRGKPDSMVGAEMAGIRAITNRFIPMKAAGNEIPAKNLQLQGLVLFRYADLCTEMLTRKPVDPATKAQYEALLIVCDEGFGWLCRAMDLKPPKPLRNDNPESQRLTVLTEWTPILKGEKFGFKDADLAPPKPAKAEEPVKTP